jgi:hypothetical protein
MGLPCKTAGLHDLLFAQIARQFCPSSNASFYINSSHGVITGSKTSKNSPFSTTARLVYGEQAARSKFEVEGPRGDDDLGEDPSTSGMFYPRDPGFTPRGDSTAVIGYDL